MNALGHCMRKALSLVWGVWRNGRDFDPDWGVGLDKTLWDLERLVALLRLAGGVTGQSLQIPGEVRLVGVAHVVGHIQDRLALLQSFGGGPRPHDLANPVRRQARGARDMALDGPLRGRSLLARNAAITSGSSLRRSSRSSSSTKASADS